ncbi:hypothetical protein TanjilG_10409 [Lupinus angustifolius]|uniref:Myb-like domain-containing protein n=2 Tax=Lupinus angustifolius TaxID=3871 RepID=A0A4P1R409_LUPAN|nr:hypothetical protein TanjilG_10409 [Lupinus angustifolius]
MDARKSTITFEQTNKENYANQVAKKHRKGESSTLSCLPLFNEKWDSLEGTQGHVAFHVTNDIAKDHNCGWKDSSHLSDSIVSLHEMQGRVFDATNDREKYCIVCCEDYSHLNDFDESDEEFLIELNRIKQGDLKKYSEISKNKRSYMIETSIKEKSNSKLFKELKPLVNEDFDVSNSRNSYSLILGKENCKIGQPLPFHSNRCPKLAIPIGPRFQAEIPQWEDLNNTRQYNIDDDDDSKWFGNEIWPMPNIMETNTKGVGNGRPKVCSCDIPGSIDCVQLHISEAREWLKLEIGATFSTWKFDEMGEDVSKSWTMDEQKEFELLTRLCKQSKNMDFWKNAMEKFPSKPLKNMINYYYNVCIPRRMRTMTRASFGTIDSDDDNLVGYERKDKYSSTRMQMVPICKLSKSKSTKYL